MTGKNLDEAASASRPDGVKLGPAGARPAPRDARRALLTGGLAAGSLFVTLSSRPALAVGSTCTISGMISGVGSVHTGPSIGGCGSPPSCWASRTTSWEGGFNGSSQFTTTFMGGAATAMAYSGTNSFTACLAGSTTPKLVVTFGSHVANSTSVILQQCVAAVLNAALFGSDHAANSGHDYYNHGSVSTVITYINNWLKAASQGKASPTGGVGSNNTNMASNATTCMTSLTSTLNSWNIQGGSSC
jgi:hypothetical protein